MAAAVAVGEAEDTADAAGKSDMLPLSSCIARFPKHLAISFLRSVAISSPPWCTIYHVLMLLAWCSTGLMVEEGEEEAMEGGEEVDPPKVAMATGPARAATQTSRGGTRATDAVRPSQAAAVEVAAVATSVRLPVARRLC